MSAILSGKMVYSCCAVGCTNGYEDPGIRFFFIPSDNLLRDKWIAAIKREIWTPSKHSKICSHHFITGKQL